MVGTTAYVIGGVGHRTVETFDMARNGTKWQITTSLPGVVARACAVTAFNETIFVVGGHDNVSTNSLPTGYSYRVSEGKWTAIAEMNVPRRDHACLFLEMEDNNGILVTGGKKFQDLKISRNLSLTVSFLFLRFVR